MTLNEILSHALLWFVLALAAVGTVTGIGAMFALGRSSYHKD